MLEFGYMGMENSIGNLGDGKQQKKLRLRQEEAFRSLSLFKEEVLVSLLDGLHPFYQEVSTVMKESSADSHNVEVYIRTHEGNNIEISLDINKHNWEKDINDQVSAFFEEQKAEGKLREDANYRFKDFKVKVPLGTRVSFMDQNYYNGITWHREFD